MEELVRGRRWSIPLVITGVVVGALAISPGVDAAGRFLKVKKAHKLFQTQTETDARYLFDTIVVNESDTVTGNGSEGVTVMCPAGYQALGGGATETEGNFNLIVDPGPKIVGQPVGTAPSGTYSHAEGWHVEVINQDASEQTYMRSVVCAKPVG